MKIKDLEKCLTEFIQDNDTHAIIIDGVWGCGKTYFINAWCKQMKKDNAKLKIGKLSFFGKESIDEVHSDLYSKLNKGKIRFKKIANIISKIVGLGIKIAPIPIKISGVEIGSLEISTKDDCGVAKPKKTINTEMNTDTIIVLDDLERKNVNINIEDLLGYIDDLISQGCKVIVISNLNELKEEEKKYKEKVFDRIYRIDEIDKEIIEQILGKNYQYVNDDYIEKSEKNLRNIIKANALFNKVVEHFKDNFKDDEVLLALLYRLCLLVVLENLSNKCLNQIKKENKEKSNYDPYFSNYSESVWALLKEKEITKEDVQYCQGVEDVFNQNDFSKLDSIFMPKENTSILINTPYQMQLLSQENKEKRVNDQIKYLINSTTLTEDEKQALPNTINYWLWEMIDQTKVKKNKNKIFNKLYEFKIKLDRFMESNNQSDFYNGYDKFKKNKETDSLIGALKKHWNNKDYDKLLSALKRSKLQINYSHHAKESAENDNTKKLIEFLIDNDFFFSFIGDITLAQFEMNKIMYEYICVPGIHVSYDSGIKAAFEEYINKLLKEGSEHDKKTINQRINYLTESFPK